MGAEASHGGRISTLEGYGEVLELDAACRRRRDTRNLDEPAQVRQQFIGLYLGQSSVASSYGATGSVMILLLWVYYSCQILLLGAGFTRAYALRQGTQPDPEPFAEKDLVALGEATGGTASATCRM